MGRHMREMFQEMPLSRKTMLEDSQRKTMCALDVFTAAVKALKDHLIGTLMQRDRENLDRGQGLGANNYEDLIHWVLTVPAIWDDAAKQFMRESAINVNMYFIRRLHNFLPLVQIDSNFDHKQPTTSFGRIFLN